MEENVQNPQSQPQKKGGKKIGCWVGGCFVLLITAVLVIGGIVAVAMWATQGPVKAVHAQLACLRQGDVEGAYMFTAGNFQKATTLEQFKRFIAENPSLGQNKSSSFTSRKIENGVGYIEGTLTAADGAKIPVRYELIKENEAWKILYIEVPQKGAVTAQSSSSERPVQTVKPVVKPEPSVSTLVEKVEVGTQRAADGRIEDAATRFPQGIGDIKVSAYVSGAKKDQKIQAVWYFASDQITQPVVNVISEDGNFISQFFLGCPANGWPTGNYKVVIFVDDGKIKNEVSYSIGQ